MPIDWRFQLGLRLLVHRTFGPLHTGFDFETIQHAGHSTRQNYPIPQPLIPNLVWDIMYGLCQGYRVINAMLSYLAPWRDLV